MQKGGETISFRLSRFALVEKPVIGARQKPHTEKQKMASH
jgi:hypothetical protein